MNGSPVDCQNRGVTEPQRDGRAEGEGRIFREGHVAKSGGRFMNRPYGARLSAHLLPFHYSLFLKQAVGDRVYGCANVVGVEQKTGG